MPLKTDALVHWSCNTFFNKEMKAILLYIYLIYMPLGCINAVGCIYIKIGLGKKLAWNNPVIKIEWFVNCFWINAITN